MEKNNLLRLGIQEMNAEEIKNINGGSALVAFIVGYILIEAILNPSAHIKAFKEGMEMAK